MSNSIKTLTAGDITRKALSILHNKLVFVKTINKQYDDRFARAGAKNGGYLEIRDPNQFTVRSGAVMDTQDVTETTQELVVATQLGVDINFSSVELTLSLDDFSDRILTPAMSRLAAEVDATAIAACYPYVYNFENTTFGTKPTWADLLAARAVLNQGLAPSGDRYCMVDALAANAIITDSKTMFYPASELAKHYTDGTLGTISGLNLVETEMTPRHTNGSRVDASLVTATTATSPANGATTIVFTGVTTTVKKGDVFTVAGIYAVNPETKVVQPWLQQFAVTANQTLDGSTPTAITPTIYYSGAKQNVSYVTTGSSAVVFVAAGGSGTQSTAFTNSLAFHKDAFTFVSADLEMPKGVDFAAREVFDGISMRVVRNYDITNDKFPCRIDVLFGEKTIRPQWACRICS